MLDHAPPLGGLVLRYALVQVQRVVQIHTGQDGENIGLQPGDKNFKSCKPDQRKER
jgi:hypothetical protein